MISAIKCLVRGVLVPDSESLALLSSTVDGNKRKGEERGREEGRERESGEEGAEWVPKEEYVMCVGRGESKREQKKKR